MRSLLLALALPVTLLARDNTLTPQEQKDGWILLFDGTSTAEWQGAGKAAFPEQGWEVKDGTLSVLPSEGTKNTRGGDIITTAKYSSFDLEFDFKVAPGGNSGVKYFVVVGAGGALGLEFQILDDDKHPDAKKGKEGNRTVGSLYDLIPARDKQANPPGEWNHGRILAKGSHVEHWLNGKKVLEYERGSEAFRAIVAGSKYSKIANFGEAPEGAILLQDHGNAASFKNIKLRKL